VIANLVDLTNKTCAHADSIGQLETNQAPIEIETRANEVLIQRGMPRIAPF